jgi:drug/metabolite transporter (DMT)-like permease
VKLAELVLFAANIGYATSYVATRATLGSIPPGTLAFARLAIAWTALAPFARSRAAEPPVSSGDRRTIAWMGLLGFAAAYAFSHWGISALGYVAWTWALARVPAPRAALFLNVQPSAGALLGALLLDEPLTGFTVAGGVAIVAGLAVAFGRAAR